LYVPPGFAHGYLVLSDTAEFLYKCSELYVPEWDRGIAWNDPQIAIKWGIENPVLSAKDRGHPNLSEVPGADLPSFD
jgi:dTDP-4-dehydrorhamnose 3,5-epimerase